jgi:type I restriction enzyme S subunit
MQCVSAKDAPSRAKQLLEVGDILVSTVRPNLNAVAMVEQKTDNLLVGSTGYCVLRCNNSIDKRYVFHFCQSPYFVDDMTSLATGASYPAVSSGIVKSATIPDHPIETQKQIADRLDKVTKLITLRKQQLTKLDLLVKARFIELFGDVKTGIYKFETRKLGEVAIVGSSHRVFTTEFVEDGVPFYRGTEIGELANGIKPENPYRITKEHYDRLASDETKPQIGDLLMPSICNKGQVWMVDTDEPFYYKDGRVLCISPNRKLFNCKYLEQFMREKTLVEYPKLGSGSTFAEFKIFLLKDIDVLIPPIELQNQFAAFVSQTDKSKSTIQQSLNKLELLKKSLMQAYFG